MADGEKKLQRVRTFQSDFHALQSGTATGTEVPVAVPPPAPKEPLPPVLNERPAPAPIPEKTGPSSNPPQSREPTAGRPRPLAAIPRPAANAPEERPAPGAPSMIPPAMPAQKPPEAAPLSGRGPDPYADSGLNIMEVDSVVSEGTIITDQKRERFKLLPAMWEAMNLWFSEGKHAIEEQVEKRQKAVPTVRPVEERKEIVKKAAARSALAPKDDHARLAKKLPAARPSPVQAGPALVITKSSEVPAPSWSHFEREGTQPRATEAAIPAPPPPAPKIEKPVPKPVFAPPAPAPEKPKAPAPRVIHIGGPKARPQPTPAAPPARPAPPPPQPVTLPERPVPAPEPIRAALTPARTTPAAKAPARPRRNLDWLFYVGTATTALAAIVSGAGAVWWFMDGASPESVAPTVRVPIQPTISTLMTEDARVTAALPGNRGDWYGRVADVTGGGLTAVMPTTGGAGAEREAGTGEVLSMLAWDANSTFLRSIDKIAFANLAGKPVIVLKVTAFDAAFGGLLRSEDALSRNLAPLFGEAVTASYAIGVGTVAPRFVDDISANHDVRVLKDETERERLVYGFIDQNTVIIAPDKETFSAMAGRVR